MTHPAVRDLFQTLNRHPAFQDLLAGLVRREDGPFALSGFTPAAKALYLALAWQATERPLLVITETNQTAENLAELTELTRRLDAGEPVELERNDELAAQFIRSIEAGVEQEI